MRNTDGNTVSSPSVVWGTSNSAIASVSGSGSNATIRGVSEGSVTITATSSGKNDALDMRVLAVDVPGITALLADPYVRRLAGEVNATSLLDQCDDAISNGHMSELYEGLSEINARAAGTPDETVFYAVLGVVVEYAMQLMNLGN